MGRVIRVIRVNGAIGAIGDTMDIGDGVISAQELVIAMKHLGMESASTKTEDILKEFDTNDDGMIDAYEFFNMMGEKIRNLEDNKEDMREAFEIFDTNCNGCVSIPELRSVMKQFEDEITEEQVDNIINEFHIGEVDRLTMRTF